MKSLAICIPNYNRIEKLKRLLYETVGQITEENLTGQVQICISDDCSPESPEGMINIVRSRYPQVEILFERNKENRGMDYNFLNSVMMASSEFCWIIGNDDMPAEGGIARVVDLLAGMREIDILLTPFNLYGSNNELRGTTYPLGEIKERLFDTSVREQYLELLFSVRHNSGLFGFLSNVVFKRKNWVKYRERFQDKLDTIFIQMYMNIQTLKDGAVFRYVPDKIIKNYADDETNESIERICRILIGLDGVVEYFFDGKEKEHLKRIIVDEYVSGTVWNLPDENLYKKKIRKIVSPKNQLYKKYFIPVAERKDFYDGKKFIIYGAGTYGRKAYQDLKAHGAAIIGIADSAYSKIGLAFEELNIVSVSEMKKLYNEQDAYVLVANHLALESMVCILFENQIERIGIIT